MKKIDFHIHTSATFRDAHFDFDLATFEKYVTDCKIDAVAITNHDIFDCEQFHQIADCLPSIVFPGIEVSVANGHVLVIAAPSQVATFANEAAKVKSRIKHATDYMSVEELCAIFPNLNDYLVIPHTDKDPPMSSDAFLQLRPTCAAGEVDSAKKFIKAAKDDTKLTPVLFSDLRIRAGIPRFPARQTFVHCGDVTISALKSCFIDKTKVALSAQNGNDLWPALPEGGLLSTGLNVVTGARSSGKTHLLQGLKESTENALLIPQFSLVNESESQYLEHLERTRTTYADDYLLNLKRVLDAVMAVDLDANARELDEYLRTLLRAADEADRRDAFSQASLFSAEEFPPVDDQTLTKLVESVRQVIENLEFKHIVEKYVDVQSLKRLACELIELLWERQGVSVHKQLANEIINDAKRGLRIRTSATQVAEIDLYKHSMDDHRVARFRELASYLKERAVIHEKTLQGFRIQAIREPFAGALEVRTASGTKLAFSSAFKQYEDPYLYLRELLEIGGLARADLYKLFIKISYRILNRDGYEVSGGERSEFRLLQAIGDAQNFDLLLVDEPESSFDNLFLKTEVNSLLKQISTTMPVVVVTHNSTLGASANADYLLRTTKTLEDGNIRYRVYGGYPTDRTLRSTDGTEIGCFESLVTTLEAGEDAYLGRRKLYEAAKDRE